MAVASPFDRLLAEVQDLASRDPLAAWARLDGLYGKSLTDLDVRRLGAIAGHLGGTGLGRYAETLSFLERCCSHPALEAEGETLRSLKRAMAVQLRCLERNEEAEAVLATACANPADRVRIDALSAQALAARGRADRAAELLDSAARGAAGLDPAVDAETLSQVIAIAANLAQTADARARRDHHLALSAARAARRAGERIANTWRDHHKLLHLEASMLLAQGRPAEALQRVQTLMSLERSEAGNHEERFHTAALACRCQMARGQLRIATAARGACADLAAAAEPLQRERLQRSLANLDEQLAELAAALAPGAGG